LSEAFAARLLIVGGREQLTPIIEQQHQVTSELDKLRLERKDVFLYEQFNKKNLKTVQQVQDNLF